MKATLAFSRHRIFLAVELCLSYSSFPCSGDEEEGGDPNLGPAYPGPWAGNTPRNLPGGTTSAGARISHPPSPPSAEWFQRENAKQTENTSKHPGVL